MRLPFTTDGGKLTIEMANCYLDESYVSSLSEPVNVGQYVMIAVADIHRRKLDDGGTKRNRRRISARS